MKNMLYIQESAYFQFLIMEETEYEAYAWQYLYLYGIGIIKNHDLIWTISSELDYGF